MGYSIEKINEIISGHRFGTTFYKIKRLLTDSRSLSFAEETIFFALRSERNDGHRYVLNLYQRGVRNFVVEALPDDADNFEDTNFLVVDDSLCALQRLASYHRHCYNIPIIGITGSNGKTIVKEWLYQILSSEKVITRSPRSYNSQIGVPLSLWNIDERTEIALIEAGISKPGEMERLARMISPTIGLLTHLGVAHEEHFATKSLKVGEKLKLFTSCDVLVYRCDNKTVSDVVEKFYEGKRFTWSMTDRRATLYIEKIEQRQYSTVIYYVYEGKLNHYELPFIDDASIENSVGCLCIALLFGISPNAIQQRMSCLEPVAMRLEVKEGLNGLTLINDYYNSDIHSLEIALDFMSRRPDQRNRTRTMIISDILQSGMTDSDLYGQVALLARQYDVMKIIGIGERIAGQKSLFDGIESSFYINTNEFIRSSDFRNLHDEVVLLKGARKFGFERLSDQLSQKVHETILEVNLNSLVDNLNHYRSQMQPSTKLVCMIKADAYGAGAVEVAKTLQDHQVDYLAVAVADEGVALRQNGITQNIMVMNPEMSSFKTIFTYGLEPEVYSFRLLNALITEAERLGLRDYPIHIKLDTGMHRLGFNPNDDVEQLIFTLKNQSALTPRSVFSHFVGADDDCFDDFSDEQFRLFWSASERLQGAFEHKILRHICNSAGIEHFKNRQLDMCRLGLGLYGISPRGNKILNTVSTLTTTILQIRNVKAGDTIGYSRKGKVEKDSRIAAIPIGYADGLNRRLGNRNAYCLINGQRAEYVGNICMDVAMVDVTGIDCQEGDSVTIFGEELPVTTLSDAIGTIPYEILTGVSNRVKRIYYHT